MIASHFFSPSASSPTSSTPASPPARGSHRLLAAGASAALVCGLSLALAVRSGPAFAATADVPLGTTAQFGVLAGSGITNTGTTTIAGDIGSDPTSSISGGNTIVMTSGTIRGTMNDPVVQQAKVDLVTAYDAAAAATPEAPAPPALPADLGGQTLTAGVHTRSGAVGLTGTLTLDGAGVASSVFIIRISSDVTTATDSRVLLVNGAQACHVYWQIDGSATFGTRTSFVGNVFAMTSITAVTNSTFDGRLLARTGAVTLQANTIFRSACAPTTPATTPTATTPAPTTPTTSTPTTSTPAPGGVGATSPTATPSTGGGGGGSGDGGGSDGDADGSGSSDGDADGSGSSDADGSTTDTGLPGTGGPAKILAPLGVALALVGGGLVAMTGRRGGTRRGAHRA